MQPKGRRQCGGSGRIPRPVERIHSVSDEAIASQEVCRTEVYTKNKIRKDSSSQGCCGTSKGSDDLVLGCVYSEHTKDLTLHTFTHCSHRSTSVYLFRVASAALIVPKSPKQLRKLQ
jgi:hypothetical protein